MAIFNKKKGSAGQATPGVAPLIMQILQGCCKEREKAVLLWPDLMHVSKATFVEVDEETFALANPSQIKMSLLDPGLPVVVSFNHLGRIFSFVTWFVLFTEGGENGVDSWLVLSIPKRIAATDSRKAAWIKVIPNSGFRLLIKELGGKSPAFKATSICLTGINLEIVGKNQGLKVDSKLNLTMGVEEAMNPVVGSKEKVETKWEPIEIEAVVRSIEGNKYNLYFPICLKPEGIMPPGPLRQLVMKLERSYLQFRAQMDDEEEDD